MITPLGEEEARDELFVVARGSHRDGQADAAQADLERLLDDEMILALRGVRRPHFDNTMTDRGNAARNFELRIQTHGLS